MSSSVIIEFDGEMLTDESGDITSGEEPLLPIDLRLPFELISLRADLDTNLVSFESENRLAGVADARVRCETFEEGAKYSAGCC